MSKTITHADDVQTKKPVEVFGITTTTMKRLLTQKNPANLIALYVFLLHTANRQRTQIVYANEWFIGQALKWSEAKVSYLKKQLRGLKLIETVKRLNAKGRVTKHYVRLAFAADVQSLKIQSLKKPVGGKIRDNAYESILNASEGMDACESKSKEDSGFTAVGSFSKSAESSSAVESKPTAGKKPSVSAVWKPDMRAAREKLAALQPPRDFPSECEFDEHLDSAGLYLVPTYRSDLYRELCARKWRHLNKRTQKWDPIRDWRKYVAALDEKIWDKLGTGRKTDAAAPEIKSPAVPAAPPAVVYHAAVTEPPPVVAPAAARPVAPAIASAVKSAEIRPAMACATATAPSAPRPAYREPQAVEGDEIPAELETAL